MTANAITIRLAEPRDAQVIALMSRDYVESGLGWKYDASRIARALGDRDTVCVVASDASRGTPGSRDGVAGFAIMEFSDERAHLVLLAVRPSLRRSGIGRRIIAWLTDSALTAGIESVHLELRRGNEAARSFYRAMGFSESIVVPGYYRGRESALRMLRVLRAPGLPAYTWTPPAR